MIGYKTLAVSPKCAYASVSHSSTGVSNALCSQLTTKRNLMGFVRNALGLDPPANPHDPTPENRFHPWVESPYPDLQNRAKRIMEIARCPVTNEKINFTCPLSGIPTHASKEAWERDTKYHESKKYELLKKCNIYEHDLRSGRPFPEFDFPLAQDRDRMINVSNWDLYFYTRQYYSMDTEFQLAAVTKMLSYPITIASVLHQFSPYSLNPKGPITLEGLKSLSALRYTLYPGEQSKLGKNLAKVNNRAMRIFILGARAESQLPPHVWKQLNFLYPGQNFEIHFIGPECYYDRTKRKYITSNEPIKQVVDNSLTFVYHTDYFHVYHLQQDFFPYDPYLDVFFCFHPGFGAAESKSNWMGESFKALLETKCGVFTTGYHKADLLNDWTVLKEAGQGKMDVLMDPTKNVFGSTKWELNDANPQEVYQFNMWMAGFRGKRYHAINV
ncbi:translational activator for mitochondrial COX1 [Hanseniaspora osmophila]|uniref:Protein MSS51, mitochondrial n=1 Tax=Hanseniaspora osmophila TaxID=56408 RepID=A0A1E5RB35_9ASCO|nr:Protein MSS51, mitochondrial [Hanseniaspora osmophila]